MNPDTTKPAHTFTGFPPGGHMNCPMCNYPLKGLPAEHSCPECGFNYDKETYLWILHSKRPGRFLFIFGVGCNLIGATILGFGPTLFAWPRNAFTSSLVILGLCSAAALILNARRWRRFPPMICLSPAGIHNRIRSKRFKSISFDGIKRIQLAKPVYGRSFYLTMDDGSFAEINTPLVDAEDCEQFVRLVTERLSRQGISR